MSQVNFHPAPGLGDLMQGWFVVPQNPVRDGGTVLVPSVQATAPGRVLRKPRLGEFLPGTFTVPQNPVAKNLATHMGGLACGSGGCAGDGYQPNYSGMSGFDMASITGWLQQPSVVSAAVPNWVLWGGVAVGGYLLLMPGGREYREKSRALRSEYRGYRRVARRVNPRRRRNIEQGFWRGGVFHPIRASDDYEPDTVGEKYQYAPKKKKSKKRSR